MTQPDKHHLNLQLYLQVSSPHEVLVVPEMYLTLANLIQTNNKSIRFMAWAKQNNVQY